jgi:ferredoxin
MLRRRRDLRLRAPSRLPRCSQGQAQRARLVPGRGGAARERGREGLRRHRAAAREAAGRARRARLAGQAHQSGFARIRLLAETDHCGQCRACLDACPTRAFPAPYRLDARRCISYLTIEHEGPIPQEFRPAIGNRIYGCDDCLAACPWNKFAVAGREAKLAARADLDAPPLTELARLDDASFRSLFAGGPVKRIGRARFVRNVMIAVGNSNNRALGARAVERLDDESPLVRGAAVWALARLISREKLSSLASEALPRERDAAVIEEWRDALAAPLGR